MIDKIKKKVIFRVGFINIPESVKFSFVQMPDLL